jgi:hypothetical protein
MRAKEQGPGKQRLGEWISFPSEALASRLPLRVFTQTYASFSPRYVLVNSRVNLIRRLCGPPAGSRARMVRISPNRSCKTDAGRAPAGASRSRKSTARILSSPSLNDFFVVLSVVSICCSRVSIVIQRLALLWLLSLCFFARSLRTYRG